MPTAEFSKGDTSKGQVSLAGIPRKWVNRPGFWGVQPSNSQRCEGRRFRFLFSGPKKWGPTVGPRECDYAAASRRDGVNALRSEDISIEFARQGKYKLDGMGTTSSGTVRCE
jgi:hypothetical protein